MNFSLVLFCRDACVLSRKTNLRITTNHFIFSRDSLLFYNVVSVAAFAAARPVEASVLLFLLSIVNLNPLEANHTNYSAL